MIIIYKELLSKKRILNIQKGAQFKTKGGVFFFILFLISFLLAIFLFDDCLFIGGVFFIIFGIILFDIVLDIRGVEINYVLHLIRDYKSLFGFKIGSWYNLKEYTSIHVMQSNVSIGTSKYSEHRCDTWYFYLVCLVDEHNSKELLLADFNNYYKAKKFAEDFVVSVSDISEITIEDFVKHY